MWHQLAHLPGRMPSLIPVNDRRGENCSIKDVKYLLMWGVRVLIQYEAKVT